MSDSDKCWVVKCAASGRYYSTKSGGSYVKNLRDAIRYTRVDACMISHDENDDAECESDSLEDFALKFVHPVKVKKRPRAAAAATKPAFGPLPSASWEPMYYVARNDVARRQYEAGLTGAKWSAGTCTLHAN